MILTIFPWQVYNCRVNIYSALKLIYPWLRPNLVSRDFIYCFSSCYSFSRLKQTERVYIRNRDVRGGEEDSQDVFAEEKSNKRIEQIQELILKKRSKKQQQSHVRNH